jgi:hypothetical protein
MALGEYEDAIDTTLTPPGTQYGATPGKQGKRNRLIYAGFATHEFSLVMSRKAVRVRSSALLIQLR